MKLTPSSFRFFKTLLALIAGPALGLGTPAAYSATASLTLNGVNWGTNYYNPDVRTGPTYDAMPNATLGATSPAWVAGSTSGSAALVDDYIKIDTSASGTAQSYRQIAAWDPTKDSTVEWVMKVESQTGTASAGSILCAGQSKYITLTIGTSQLTLGNKVVTGLDFTQWTTFRLTLTGMNTATPQATLYINGSTTPIATAAFNGSSALTYLQFGDGNSGASESGITDWREIRWTSAGAFAPVPEPSSMILGGLGAALWIFATNRRNRP